MIGAKGEMEERGREGKDEKDKQMVPGKGRTREASGLRQGREV